jgi:hypothetical protein
MVDAGVDLDPDKETAILRYLANGQRPRLRRGKQHHVGLPIVPELLDSVEAVVVRLSGEQDYRRVQRVAARWIREGFSTAIEVLAWLDAGASLSDASVAGDLARNGVTPAVARLNAGRDGIRTYSAFTYYELVEEGFLSAADASRLAARRGQLGNSA